MNLIKHVYSFEPHAENLFPTATVWCSLWSNLWSSGRMSPPLLAAGSSSGSSMRGGQRQRQSVRNANVLWIRIKFQCKFHFRGLWTMGEQFWPEGCILLPLILLYVTPGVSLLQGNQERTPHKEYNRQRWEVLVILMFLFIVIKWLIICYCCRERATQVSNELAASFRMC